MSTPRTMKAFTIPTRTEYTEPTPTSSLALDTSHPFPDPTPTQALIRIHAAAITPYELTWPNSFAPQPRIPCHDVSGTVVSAPAGSGFSAGEEVFCLLPFTGPGGLAEYASVEPEFLAKMPEVDGRGMGFVEAASLPRAGMTVLEALKVLRERDGGWEGGGARVLITGATGAVGRMGLQVFKHVVGSSGWVGAVGGKGSEGLKDLGADFVANYREESEWEVAVGREGGVDVVFDCVGGETLERCLGLVNDGATIITVASPPPEWKELKGWKYLEERGVKGLFYIVTETGEGLKDLAKLVETSIVKPSASIVVDGLTEEGVRAGWTKGQSGGIAGSVVVRIV